MGEQVPCKCWKTACPGRGRCCTTNLGAEELFSIPLAPNPYWSGRTDGQQSQRYTRGGAGEGGSTDPAGSAPACRCLPAPNPGSDGRLNICQ